MQWMASDGTVPCYGHNRGITVNAQKWLILMYSANAWNFIISALLLDHFVTALFPTDKIF